MNTNIRMVTGAVFLVLCCVLGYFAPDLHRHLPWSAGVFEIAAFLGLILLLVLARNKFAGK